MRKIISLICFLLPVLAFAGQTQTPPQLRQDAPDRYTVIKGDTLWDISGKFFSDPWKWPYIWGMNKDSIRDPHWIYPGETIVLDRASGTLSVGDATSSNKVIKLSPQTLSMDSSHNAIPSIPPGAIEPFLSQPLIVSDDLMALAPRVVGLPEERVMVGKGDTVYVSGVSENEGNKWQVYRPGKLLTDPVTHELLGHEAIYLGSVDINEFGKVSTAIVTDTKLEINAGDRLIAATAFTSRNYLPRAPEQEIDATIISIYGGVSQGGQNTVITLNKGARDGLQNGHVLALYSKGGAVTSEGKSLKLPDVRYGLTYVFRVFDKVSYALVMQTRLPAQLLDRASTP